MKKLEDFKKKVMDVVKDAPSKFVWGKDDITVEPHKPEEKVNGDKFSWNVGDLTIEPKEIVKKLSNKFTWGKGDLTIHNNDDKKD